MSVFKTRMERLEQQKENLEAWRAYYEEMSPKVDSAVEKIKAALYPLHLVIPPGDLSARVTGNDKEEDTKPNREEHCIRIEITARCLDGKFKFIKFQGYDSRGSGRNQKTLNAKAEKIAKGIESHLPDGSTVSVNPFSLETDRSEKPERDRVLVSVWIK